MTKAKVFLQAITIVNENFMKAKQVLSDMRLTQLEKQIIQAYSDLRENRFNDIVTVLSKQKSDDPFVESQRNMMIGLAYNNSGDLKLALPYFEIAWEEVKETPYEKSKFIILYNLFTLHRNLKQADAMGMYLELMDEVAKGAGRETVLMFLRSRFYYFSHIGDIKKAKALLNELEKCKHELGENQVLSYHVDKFDYYIKCDQYEDCYRTLEEMKQFRVYATGFNFKFMKILLDHVALGKPIYAYDKDFKAAPILYYMLNVVKSLEAGDTHEASKWWNELNLLSSDIYQSGFIYKGDKCLFSVAYQKHIQSSTPIIPLLIDKDKSKEQALLELLQAAKGPLRKDQIYKMIWGEELKDKSELLKLSQLVTRVKKKFNVVVKTRKGCYYLEQQPLVKKVG